MLKTVFAIRPIFRETWETDYQFDHYEIAQGLLFKEEKNYFEDREPLSFLMFCLKKHQNRLILPHTQKYLTFKEALEDWNKQVGKEE